LDNIKKIMIAGSGENYSEEKVLSFSKDADFIIACDGGLNILDKLKIKPHLILGDFDSVDPKILSSYKDVKREQFKSEKDLTDSEIALQEALSLNPEEIYLLGMTGSYFDHSLGNIFNLLRNYASGTEINIVTDNSIISAVSGKKQFNNLSGRRISFFPLGEVKDFKMEGFKYLYKKNNLGILDYSVSNVIECDSAEISFISGFLLAILFDEGYN